MEGGRLTPFPPPPPPPPALPVQGQPKKPGLNRVNKVCAKLAQLVRSDCQPEGPGFNPRPGRGLNFRHPVRGQGH